MWEKKMNKLLVKQISNILTCQQHSASSGETAIPLFRIISIGV